MREYKISDEWGRRAEKIIHSHEDLKWLRSMDARICYITSDEDKHTGDHLVFGECIKVRDLLKCLIPYDFLIVFYETNIRVIGMGEKEKDILTYHELLHCDFAEKKTGEIVWKVKKHDVEDFDKILEEYGAHWALGGRDGKA